MPADYEGEDMDKISLNGEWQLKLLGESEYPIPKDYVPAKIPGSVYGTYLEQGLMPDPYYRDNELKATELMENDFEYKKEFDVKAEQLTYDRLLLVFEGIDTLADIYLNGALLDSTNNMHLRYEYEVGNLLHVGSNELKVILHSPIKYIKEENEKIYTGGSHDAMEGYPHLRKAHCMFGWDWGPRLPDAGLFRPVYLCGIRKARITEMYIWQEHEEGQVTLRFSPKIEELVPVNDLNSLQITVHTPDGQILEPDEDGSVLVKNPALWWPNGYGSQPLYTVRAVLTDGTGEELDSWERRIGLRKVTVDTHKDEWGNCFAHRINGLNIFAMGADYIPEDNLLGRCSRERTRQLLEDAASAHHNCIRVWGGGFYPEDYFYDICDELGLLVWQDFMFACSSYELDEAFDESISKEIEQNIRRIRHHACLGLWCGNNEMETQTLDGVWKPSIKQKADYIKIYEYIIPRIVKREDPQTFYWPSSPSSGGNFDNPWDENRGDTHYWDVWHGEKPFTDYRKYRFRYLSEFGFQAFPCLKTVEGFTEPEDRNIFSRVMEMHQRNRAANGKILQYISQTYLYPKDFEHLLYASQLLQAEAIRYGVEHFRRYRGQCMGALVWQLNDIWPVASWASIDYFGRWKALHYAESKMFAPILLSCEEQGELSGRPSCIMERKAPIEISAKLHVANETWEKISGTVYWELRSPDAAVLKEGKEEVEVEPFDGVWLPKLDFSEYDEMGVYISYRFVQNGQVVSESTTLFTPPKHFRFMEPHLQLQQEDDVLTVSASAYAKSVEIYPLDGEAKFSDNYFDLNADSRSVKIVSGDAKNFGVRSVYEIAH